MIIITIILVFVLGFSYSVCFFFFFFFLHSFYLDLGLVGYFDWKSLYSFEIEITELDDRRVGSTEFVFHILWSR